ncbi:MAG: alkaline phosphatase family protein, partial [Thermoproteota archaeon]
MNIALISMDCVRPDYLDTPFFRKLRGESLEFTNCIVQASHTSTSHTSILTGLYPFNHGVRWLVNFSVEGKMIQEILKEEGYATAGFIGGFPLT